MDLDPTALTDWLAAFLMADYDATSEDAPERRAAFCSAAVAEGLASLPSPEAPIISRVLFKATLRTHPRSGAWLGAIVSEATGARRGAGKYHLLLVVQRHLGAPRVTGIYDVCTACVALGVDGQGAQCIECSGLGWEPWFGVDLGSSWGPLTAVHRATRPSTPLYLPAWKRGAAP
ncbi:MAG: hypothetical protein ACPGU1_15410 [Myxococcota bacterium]